MESKIYVGGEFVSNNQPLPVLNKFSGQVFAQTFVAGKYELEHAIEKAEAVKIEMRDMPSWKKYKILMQIVEGIKTKREFIAQIIAQEAGKPMRYALGEVDRAIQTFLVAAEESKRIPKEYFSIDWTPAGEGKEGFIKYFPVGIVAGISPFNFPLNLTAHKIGPAIAAGCPIILKPARSTPISVLELAKIIHESDLPKGAFSVLPMDREAGNQLVTDDRFAKLTFTGSPAVGWKMKREAGRKKVTLELGGNAGVVVSKTANIDTAVAKCLAGSFAYSGQVCIHVQRIYVHEDVFDAFSKKFVEKTSQLKYGDPTNADTEISVMIDEDNAKRVEVWVNEAVENGARILHGGKRKGNYYEPTIITNSKREMKVCSLEVFGPVITLEKYSDYKKAIADVNDSQFGLQAGVFTDSNEEISYAFNELEVGGLIVNDVPTFRVDHMPYGGVKNSGFGREGVKFAIMEMLEPRLLVKN